MNGIDLIAPPAGGGGPAGSLHSPTSIGDARTARDAGHVWLLHGFGARPFVMKRMARLLNIHGHATRLWGYSSTRQRIAEHASALRDEVLRAVEAEELHHVDFVTHSLGSIIVRQMLCDWPSPLIRRVVMLAPPNGGSHFARFGSLLLKPLCPVLSELSSSRHSVVNRMDEPPATEIGVIAASSDWVVRRRNTHLSVEADHIVIKGDHVRLPLLRVCADQASHFLWHGRFDRAVEGVGCGPPASRVSLCHVRVSRVDLS